MLLKPIGSGDIVDIVAPASACSREELKNGVAAVRQLGLIPRLPKNIFGKSILFANSDEKRLQHFHSALNAPDSGLLWCVRGGYGAIRLMPEIARWPRPKRAKILLGYSDITTLHVHLNQRWGWPTLHGPLLDRLGRSALSPKELAELLGLLYGTAPGVEFTRLKPLNSLAKCKTVVRAPIFGGNMTVLQSGIGTSSALKPRNCILFFEDTGERPHRVDRMLTQFSQAGWFDSCKGILLGDFLLANPVDRRNLWRDVFGRFAKDINVPVVAGLPVGHEPSRNRTLPLCAPAELFLGSTPRLKVASGIRSL